jgi:ATP-dependent Lon protease
LSSYTNQEKKQIFSRHLLPKAIRDSGLENSNLFSFEDAVVDKLIQDYCREPGVRSLERHTKKVIDKIAYQIVTHREEHPDQVLPPIVATTKNLKDFVGNAIFEKEQIYSQVPPVHFVNLGSSYRLGIHPSWRLYSLLGSEKSHFHKEHSRSRFPFHRKPW